MRLTLVTRPLVAAAAVLGLGAGTLMGGGTAFAGSAPAAMPATTRAVAPVACDNLGLDTEEGKSVQGYLDLLGFDPGAIDGCLGPTSWRAFQHYLNSVGDDAGRPDGVPGTRTIQALQHYLNDRGFRAGPNDGIPGPMTRAAFKRFADSR